MSGASFQPINLIPRHFETTVSQMVRRPWLAEKMETTFMNREKEFNQPPVETYKYLKLLPPSPDMQEGFYDGFNSAYLKIFMIIIVLLIVYNCMVR